MSKGFAAELPMFVLDVLRHDVAEPLESILRMLNHRSCIGWREFWPHNFSADEVRAALDKLVRDGEVQPLCETDDGNGLTEVAAAQDRESLWYAMTPAGRSRWEAWELTVAVV